MPDDITIALPTDSPVAEERLHLLAYIPWDDRYHTHIPPRYAEFFKYVLPYLNARTTNVHTAFSVSHLEELISLTPEPVDRDVLYVAVILHDCGWAQLDHDDIADSLTYNSVESYSPRAVKPKEMHATLGSHLAKRLLREYTGDPQLTNEQQKFVCDLVYYHDLVRPWPGKPEPIEYLLLGDADRLWSYTYENFWLDTVRKNTEPRQYLKNLQNALEDFFLVEQGKAVARRLIADRADEVGQLG